MTHDYLVHALREWLTRKQRETRRGRAELLLAERAALWSSQAGGSLPALVAGVGDHPAADQAQDWSRAPAADDAPRRAPDRAREGLGLAIVLGIVTAAFLEIYSATHADGLVKRLESADISRVPVILPEIAKYRRWAEPQLRRIVSERPDDSKEKFHASLALLRIDGGQRRVSLQRSAQYLYKRLPTAGPVEMEVLRDSLESHRDVLKDRLWGELRAAQAGCQGDSPRCRCPGGLRPDESAGLERRGDKVAAAMCRAPLADLEGWHRAMSGIRERLVGPLGKILRDGERREEHAIAASLLADYARDMPDQLVDLLLDADPKLFSILFPAVQRSARDCLDPLGAAVASALPGPTFEDAARAAAGTPSPSTVEIERAKDRLASRGAKSGVALLRLGHDEGVWRLLEYSPDPRSRCDFVNALSNFGADPTLLVSELGRLGETKSIPGPIGEKNAYLFDPVISNRRALLMALAGYPKDALAPGEREALVRRLERLYREDPDAGVHSAAELLLRRWAYSDRLKLPPGGGDREGRRWYVNPEGQTMVLVDGPVVFDMGSPETDPEHNKDDVYHRREILRPFFIASKEVTIEEFRRFATEEFKDARPFSNRYSAGPDGPMIEINWYEAAGYCNWLSDREGLRQLLQTE